MIHGLACVTLPCKRNSHEIMRVGIVWLLPQRLLERINRLVRLAEIHLGNSQIHQSADVVRLQLDGGGIVLRRALRIAKLHSSASQRVMCIGMVGIDAKCGFE